MTSLFSIGRSRTYLALLGLLSLCLVGACSTPNTEQPIVVGDYVLQAGHPSLAAWQISKKPQAPAENAQTANRVELGRSLFFETALSSNQDRSCGSCHDPELMWSDGLPTALDLSAKSLPRATPSLVNVAYAEPIMWDGRSPSLEHQAMLPILNEREMGGDVDLDFEKGRCAVCHDAPYFTDNSFHNIRLPSAASEELDVGRYAVKPVTAMVGAFRTPQLREISATAPYFHDGSSTTLPEVIEHYVSGFESGPHLSAEMRKLELTWKEKADLAEILTTLNSTESARENLLVASTHITEKENK